MDGKNKLYFNKKTILGEIIVILGERVVFSVLGKSAFILGKRFL